MNLKAAAHAQKDAYLASLKELVRLESPTSVKSANDKVADYLQTFLAQEGWQVERVSKAEVGDQLIARYGADGQVRTLILCHFDTVWPLGTLEKMPLLEEDGKLKGPGTMDMKAGIMTAIYALKVAKAQGKTLKGPVTLLLTSDEEKGSDHSRLLIEQEAKAHDRVLVLEPGRDDGALKIARKGIGGFWVDFKGISAHAGNNPKDGASALRELAHFLLFAESLTDYDKGTTVNVTVAQAGTVSNVICEEANCEIDMRAETLAEAERVEKAIFAYQPKDSRVKIMVEGGINRPPMEFTEQNKALFAELENYMKALDISLEAVMVGGGSDGNFTSALGVATIDGLGSAGAGAHARHEHIRIEETLDRLALVTALVSEL
ncbi:MAG: M20 family metallopeptidase [Trueperaceae bacterium]|nr:M20 family metallopeptidase [Trueperaceae bacterium]